jgi:hypothetical protein
VPSLYHTISKKQVRFVKFLPRKKKTVKMSQKSEKHWKKQGLSAVRDIELHMRTMGEMSVHKLFTQMVKESQK